MIFGKVEEERGENVVRFTFTELRIMTGSEKVFYVTKGVGETEKVYSNSDWSNLVTKKNKFCISGREPKYCHYLGTNLNSCFFEEVE